MSEEEHSICQRVDAELLDHIFYLREEIKKYFEFSQRLEKKIINLEIEISILKPKKF